MSKKEKIENAKKLLSLIIEGGEAAVKIKEGGGKLESILSNLLSLTDEFAALKDFSFDKLVAEVKDLDKDEFKELVELIKNELDISSDYTKHLIADALLIVGEGSHLVERVIGYAETLKKGQDAWKKQKVEIKERLAKDEEKLNQEIKMLELKKKQLEDSKKKLNGQAPKKPAAPKK